MATKFSRGASLNTRLRCGYVISTVKSQTESQTDNPQIRLCLYDSVPRRRAPYRCRTNREVTAIRRKGWSGAIRPLHRWSHAGWSASGGGLLTRSCPAKPPILVYDAEDVVPVHRAISRGQDDCGGKTAQSGVRAACRLPPRLCRLAHDRLRAILRSPRPALR